MFVADEVIKSVVFIGSQEEGVFKPWATGFLVLAYQRRIPDMAFPYLVTSAHVLSVMERRGLPVYCCLNRRDGSTLVTALGDEKWFVHPEDPATTDVACLPFWIDLDVLAHDYLPLFNRVDKAPRASGFNLLALGGDIFAVGLFKSGSGTERSIPIVRMGTIAAIPEDLVHTRYAGALNAYLVELRSTVGLSGSPVFVNPPHDRGVRMLDEAAWSEHVLVGLMHGHLNAPDLGETRALAGDAPMRRESDNGIGIVVPAWKIVETLYQPDSLEQMRMVAEERRSSEGSAREHGVVPLPRRRNFG